MYHLMSRRLFVSGKQPRCLLYSAGGPFFRFDFWASNALDENSEYPSVPHTPLRLPLAFSSCWARGVLEDNCERLDIPSSSTTPAFYDGWARSAPEENFALFALLTAPLSVFHTAERVELEN